MHPNFLCAASYKIFKKVTVDMFGNAIKLFHIKSHSSKNTILDFFVCSKLVNGFFHYNGDW